MKQIEIYLSSIQIHKKGSNGLYYYKRPVQSDKHVLNRFRRSIKNQTVYTLIWGFSWLEILCDNHQTCEELAVAVKHNRKYLMVLFNDTDINNCAKLALSEPNTTTLAVWSSKPFVSTSHRGRGYAVHNSFPFHQRIINEKSNEFLLEVMNVSCDVECSCHCYWYFITDLSSFDSLCYDILP